MLIVDIDLTGESPTMDPFLRGWWARFWTWLRRKPLPQAGVAEEIEEPDHVAGPDLLP